jgi:hypothetical protein
VCSYLTANGAKAAGSSVGNVGAALLLQNVTDTRIKMSALSLGSIPVSIFQHIRRYIFILFCM